MLIILMFSIKNQIIAQSYALDLRVLYSIDFKNNFVGDVPFFKREARCAIDVFDSNKEVMKDTWYSIGNNGSKENLNKFLNDFPRKPF